MLLGEVMKIRVRLVMYNDIAQLAVKSRRVVKFSHLLNVLFLFLLEVELQVGQKLAVALHTRDLK